MPKYTVQQVIQRGYQIINRHPTYSQPNRGNSMDSPQYDCSSFMGTINGVGEGAWPPATPSMVAKYTAAGYIHSSYTGMSNLKKGDILVWNKSGTSGQGSNGHTGMYIGNGFIMEMTGRGANTNPFYETFSNGQKWQDVLRNPRNGIYLVRCQQLK